MENLIHYYGDLVRKLFLAGAIIMLITLPFLNSLLPFPLFVSLFAIIALSFVAGLTSPKQAWLTSLNEATAIIAVLIFEYYAVVYYVKYSATSSLFIINQLLALNFLLAFYYNTKTLRWNILNDKKEQ